MQVSIKRFAVEMNVKQAGIEFGVWDNAGTFKGDCYVTSTGLIWCQGKTKKENGVRVTWDEFIEWMNA